MGRPFAFPGRQRKTALYSPGRHDFRRTLARRTRRWSGRPPLVCPASAREDHALPTRQRHNLFDERVVGAAAALDPVSGSASPMCSNRVAVNPPDMSSTSWEPWRNLPASPPRLELERPQDYAASPRRSGQRRPWWCSREVAGRSSSPLLTRRIAAAMPPRIRSGYRGTRRSPCLGTEQSSIEPAARVPVLRSSPEFAARWPIPGSPRKRRRAEWLPPAVRIRSG